MPCKATTALIALLVFCFPPVALADSGNRAGRDGVFVKRPMLTMSNEPTGAVSDAARTFTADKKGEFAASPLVPRARFSRGGSAVRTKPWIKFTGPRGEPVYINVEQMTSVRSDTEISEAKTQLELASGKFQRVREDVEHVMQLISATSEARETDETSSAAPICVGSD
jgi:hypothetical protein